MEHLYKSCSLKATDDTGKIAGFFSTYEKTPDSYGDIIEPGAFTNTVAKRRETGHPFPLCWNHDFDKIIGTVDAIEEKENGVYMEATFLDTAQAQDVRKFVQSGAVYQFSFAYDVIKRRDPDEMEKAAGVTNVLQEVEVYEISVVTVPANTNAVVTDVKASAEPEEKSGRRNSKSDEDVIKEIIKLANSLLVKSDNTEEPETSEEAEPEANAAAEEQNGEGNSKRATVLLEKITSLKEGHNNDT